MSDTGGGRMLRSQLLALAPCGTGTGEIEAVTGYLPRLAAAHRRLSLNDLVLRVLPTLLNVPPSEPMLVEMATARPFSLNGRNGNAEMILKMLEAGTLRTDLRSMSLLPWRHLLVDRELLRETLAWCPACLADARYERLIWWLRVVTVCPTHRSPLASTCSTCDAKQPALGAGATVAACRSCRADLAGAAAAGPPKPWDLWVACHVQDLLASQPPAAASPRGIIAHALVASGRSQKALARDAGVAVSTVSYWTNGKAAPTLEGYLRVAAAVGCTLVDLLNERVRAAGSVPVPVSAWRERRSHDWPVIEAAVRRASTHPDCPSLASVATDLAIGEQELRRRFRALTDLIVERFSARRSAAKAARIANINDAVLRALDQLVARGESLSRRKLEEELGGLLVREEAVRDAWLAAIESAYQQKKLAA